jgi:two-component system sensor histidine kinase KdpD
MADDAVKAAPPPTRPRWPVELAVTLVAVGVSTGFGLLLFGRQSLPDVAMVFVLGIVVVAMRLSFAAAVLAVVLSVLSYDFFFIPPYLSFSVDDGRHVVTFAVMFVVGVVISTLARRAREEAIERARVTREAASARLEAEAERLQSSLLSSVSHDLRTPLAVITGSATMLRSDMLGGDAPSLDPAVRRDLVDAIYDESVRLSRLVANLLDMTRLAAGALHVNKAWESIEAVVGAAVRRTDDRLAGRRLDLDVPAGLPLVAFDAVLIEQVLINLIENAAKHSPDGAPVAVVARATDREATLEVRDRGPGVPGADRENVFRKFYRVAGASAGGAGLGLAICRGVVEAHGGHIAVRPRADVDGGAGSVFSFTLPIDGAAPDVEDERGAA